MGRVVLIIVGVHWFLCGMTLCIIFHRKPRHFYNILKCLRMQNCQKSNQPTANAYTSNVSYEQAIIDAAKNVSPSVVSIVISKNVPAYEQQFVNPFGDNNNTILLAIYFLILKFLSRCKMELNIRKLEPGPDL